MRRQYLCKKKPDLLCFLKSTSVQLHVLSFVTFSILPVKCHNYLMSWEPMVSSLKGGWDRSYNTHWCWRTSLNQFFLNIVSFVMRFMSGMVNNFIFIIRVLCDCVLNNGVHSMFTPIGHGVLGATHAVVDRPTQLICISDIYLFVNRQIQKT